MYILATVCILIIAVVLVLTVLVQNSKGGGLSSSFGGGGNQFGGVAQTNKFLEKATWGLAIALLIFSLLASMTIPKQAKDNKQQDFKEYDFSTPNTASPIVTESPEEN